ncbi:recombinase family protein [Ectopseudomonas hydrolytica]|uniref:Recombinase family protein n=1 Tax=Ectopseudomonas hydrolytica TaxID=2493633 RepID=A0ABY5A3Q6_9GAMM|nr:recombinase family protein [Pseudomonas hydrolytica]USR38352.1 recombinase family protein [Pseudomonas hydrolytica]
MPNAIPYVRFSSAKQQHGSSLVRQNEAIGQWLLANPGYTLSGLRFEDLGKSGYSGQHLENGFGKLLAAIEAGAIKAGDVVLVEAIDRTGRLEPLEMLTQLTKIVRANVSVVTLDDGAVYDRASANNDRLFLLVAKVQQAHQYSDALSRRIRASYKDRRTKAAAGERVKRSTPVWLDKEGNLIPELVPIIVSAFEDYAAGLGERRIYLRIKDKHPALAKMNPSTVKRWLTNTTAIGYWGDIPDAHPPVVSKELFYRVQRAIGNRGRKKAAPTQHLLTGLVRCGACGTNFIYKALSHSPHVMACGKRARLGNSGCTNRTNWPVSVLEYIRSTTYASAVQRALAHSQTTADDKRRIELEGDIEAIGRTITRLVTLLAQHEIPEVQQQLDAAVERRRVLETQLAAVVSTPAQIDFDSTMDWSEDQLDDDPMKLNAMLQSADYALVCDGRTLTTADSFYERPGPHVFEYLGHDRKQNAYSLKHNGEQLYLALPDPEREAEELAALEKAPTRTITYRNGQLIDDATGENVEEL